jgi:hypothetical protein
MNFSRHRKKFPSEISEYFFSAWNKRELWRMDLPCATIPRDELMWHLDYPFWSSEPPAPLFDLRPRAVLDRPSKFPVHWERVLSADTQFPILVGHFGGRVVILDGHHRLVKSIWQGTMAIQCALVPREHIRLAA